MDMYTVTAAGLVFLAALAVVILSVRGIRRMRRGAWIGLFAGIALALISAFYAAAWLIVYGRMS